MANVKRTLSASVIPILIPSILEDQSLDKSYEEKKLFHVWKMQVEGARDNDKKLVIMHRRLRSEGNNAIIIPITGQGWKENEEPAIRAAFDRNCLVGLRHTLDQQAGLMLSKELLVEYLYKYFHEDPIGKNIMEAARIKNKQIQEKLERRDAPHSDKIIRETAEHIKAKHHIVTLWETGAMLYFKNGKYVYGAERIIEEECHVMFQYDARSWMIEEVKKALKRQTYRDLSEFDTDLNIINVKNGLYHIKEKTLTEHTPDYLSVNQKPIVYDPDAKCPEFDKFQSGCLYPSQIKTVKQCAAYTFYRDNPYEHYVIHVGYGWNGKSKLNNTMEKMHGKENVSHVPFNDISKDPYALADLEGKDLNIDNEPSGGIIRNTAILKKLSGRESVRVQQKYVKAHDATIHAKIWFSTNDIPDIQDDSIGRFRREIVIMWPYTFKPNPNPNNPMEKLDDPYIEDKITTEAELSGIFKMLMDELHDILYKQSKRIYVDMSDIDQRRIHRELLKNPIQFFVEDVIDLENSTSENHIRKDDLYLIYEKFTELNRIAPEDKDIFGKKLKKILKERIIDGQRESQSEADPATGKRRRIWRGIKVKPEWLDKDKQEKQTSLLTRREEEEQQYLAQGEDKEQEFYDKTIENKKVEKAVSDVSHVSDQNPKYDSPKEEKTQSLAIFHAQKSPENSIDFLSRSLAERESGRTGWTGWTKVIADVPIDAIIEKAMRDQSFFTKDDWTFACVMWPNLHWTINEAEQTLFALLKEGKIREITDKPGMYEPTPSF